MRCVFEPLVELRNKSFSNLIKCFATALLSGVFFCLRIGHIFLSSLIALSGRHSALCPDLLDLVKELAGELRNLCTFHGLCGLTAVGRNHLPDLLPGCVVLLLHILHEFQGLTVLQDGLHTVSNHFFHRRIVGDGFTPCLCFRLLEGHQFAHIALHSAVLEHDLCDLGEMLRGPLSHKVGQLVGNRKEHRTLVVVACVEVDVDLAGSGIVEAVGTTFGLHAVLIQVVPLAVFYP